MSSSTEIAPNAAAARAKFIRSQIPAAGRFAGLEWKISPAPFPLGENLAKEISICPDRFGAYGRVGLDELTRDKWLGLGSGRLGHNKKVRLQLAPASTNFHP